MRQVALLVGSLLLSAAVAGQAPEAVPPTDAVAERFARTALEQLRRGNLAALEPSLEVALRSPESRVQLAALAQRFPPGEPQAITLIGARTAVHEEQWRGSLTFEYRFAEAWALGNIIARQGPGGLEVIGLNVVRTAGAQAEINRFTLEGKSLTHYLVLGLAVAVPVFIIVTLLACLRAPPPGRRWLWLLFIAFGLGALRLNWTTGEWDVNAVSFRLLGSGVVAYGEHTPWRVSVGLPLGAVVYWVRRRRQQPALTPGPGTGPSAGPHSGNDP